MPLKIDKTKPELNKASSRIQAKYKPYKLNQILSPEQKDLYEQLRYHYEIEELQTWIEGSKDILETLINLRDKV
jgi:predicted transposase YbfD/YdcC